MGLPLGAQHIAPLRADAVRWLVRELEVIDWLIERRFKSMLFFDPVLRFGAICTAAIFEDGPCDKVDGAGCRKDY